MKATLLSKENNEAKFTMDFTAEEFEKAIIEVYKKEKDKFMIDGFRKGKAPRSIIERHYGETVFYEVSAEGKRVQIMGSLGLDPNTDYPTGADVLILPFQGRSDLEAYAAPIVRSLAPKQVLLDHYDDSFPPMTTQVETARFEALLTREYGIPCSALRKNETITL